MCLESLSAAVLDRPTPHGGVVTRAETPGSRFPRVLGQPEEWPRDFWKTAAPLTYLRASSDDVPPADLQEQPLEQEGRPTSPAPTAQGL